MKTIFDPMTREQLREIARENGVKRGRNTGDTVKNLQEAGILSGLTINLLILTK